MRIGNTVLMSFRNILKNKTRSFLTALGIIIGVGSVIVMVGVGTGSRVQIEEQMAAMGTNLIMVNAGGQRSGGGVSQGAGTNVQLTLADAERLRRDGTLVAAVSPNVQTNAQLIAESYNWRTQVNGVSAEYPAIRNYTIAAGAFFGEADVKAARSVAVLGPTAAAELFPDSDPVGRPLRVNQVPFTVIGVCASKGSSGPFDQDDYVMIPYTTAMYKITGTNYLRTIFVSAADANRIEETKAEIIALLRDQHRLREGTADDFRIGSQNEITEFRVANAETMTLLLAAIAAVSLIVGGIGIMNIMLVSVKERTREIGIRMAVGAKARDVLLQFLIEAFVLALLGGIIGVALAFAIGGALNAFTEIPVVIEWSIVAISFVFSGTVGIFFGFYPAKKASELNPIEALRYE